MKAKAARRSGLAQRGSGLSTAAPAVAPAHEVDVNLPIDAESFQTLARSVHMTADDPVCTIRIVWLDRYMLAL